MSHRFLAAACVLLAAGAAAAPRPDPADPRAPVPPLEWRSALDDYRRAAVPLPERSWREANDTVGRLGGWRAYARELQGAAPAASSASAPAAAHRH